MTATNIFAAFREYRRAHPDATRSWEDFRNQPTPPLFRASPEQRRATVAALRAEHPELFQGVTHARTHRPGPEEAPRRPLTLGELAAASRTTPLGLSDLAKRIFRERTDPFSRRPPPFWRRHDQRG